MIEPHAGIEIRPYAPSDWLALCRLSAANLSEHGVFVSLEEIAAPTDPLGPYADAEWDLDHVPDAYQSAGGGFWIAWAGSEPVGRVGAQDLGGVAELRRMFVLASHRRRGIGSALVYSLVRHCLTTGLSAIECWTARDGPGRWLYAHCGFRVVPERGPGYELVEQLTRYTPHENEIRMRQGLP